MLCNSKINNRPDKLLQSRLIKLAFSLVTLTTAIILLFLYPEYHLYLIALTAVLASLCLLQTIKTLDAGEEAISYGGFANEIIYNDFQPKRIENALGEAIIQNDPAKDLIKTLPVLNFLEQNLAEGSANKANFYRLQTACLNLTKEKTVLSLVLHREQDKIFNDLEWFEITVRPIYLKKTDIFEGPFSIKKIKKETYLYWSLKNITAAKNMEDVFQVERKSLHDFIDDLPVGLYTVDKDSTIEYANRSFADFLGLPCEELSGRALSDFLATNETLPGRRDLWHGRLHFATADNNVNEAFVFQQICRENQNIKMRGVVITSLPTSDELKDDMEHAYDKISWLFNYAPVGIIFVSPDGQILNCNPKAYELFNRKEEELSRQSVFSFIKEEETAALKKAFEHVRQNPQRSSNLEIHLTTHAKEAVVSLYISAMQRFHAAGAASAEGFVLYLIDATKQKNLELQFAQAQKMQAVGQLAGGVAHDFNNLLTAMIGFTDLLLQRHGVGDPSFADLIQIKQNANRAAGLVRQLLAFSRKQPLQPKLIDITENFTELSHMLKRILGEQITLKFRHGSDLGFIRVDPVQFSQVIINLAVNAKDAMESNGTLTISTHTDVLAEPYQFGDDTIKPGEFVIIDVSDTGCGIPPENMNRIFDPFFSTKQNVVGSGTGLGLAMVYGIVRQTEGFIKVDSEVGRGTTFSIHLPRFESDTEEGETLDSKEVVTGKDGTPIITVQEKIAAPVTINQKILLGLNVSNAIDRSHTPTSKEAENTRILFVEDEDSVRTFGVRALKKKGYEVVGCNSAENALDYMEKDPNFNMLITDMVMPGMTGAQLTKIIKDKLPEIKVILASGYSEEIVRQELDNFDDFDFITKPYSLGDLTAKVFDVLNKNVKG